MRVRIFGGVSITDSGQPSRQHLEARPRLLLGRLAAAAGTLVTDDQLIDSIWPTDPPRSARGALQGYISALRTALEPGRGPKDSGPFVVRDLNGYRLDPVAVDLDLVEFDGLVDAARRLAEGDAMPLIERALDASESAPFAEFANEPWALRIRQRVSSDRAVLLERRFAHALDRDAANHLIAPLREATLEHPYNEHLAALLMTALYRNGSQRDALTTYRQVRERLADEAGVRPSPELEAVYLAVLDHRLGGTGQAPRVDEGHGPAPRPALLGRAEDISIAAESVLAHGSVTLLGPGGVGKTSVATAVSDVVSLELGVRARIVDVAALAVDEIHEAIAQELELTTHPLTPISEMVMAAARQETVLLRLETCEVAVDRIRALLESVAGVQGVYTIVTSRVPIGHPAERRHRLDGLATDDAITLLMANRSAPPGAGERASLVELAAVLDRAPLALKMAAAHIDGLGVSGVIEGVRSGTLAASLPGSPDRHESTAAAAEWSLRLLDDEQLQMLELIAQFNQPVPERTIQSVVVASGRPFDVAVLKSLVEASLVVRLDDTEGEQRHAVLDTVKAAVLGRADDGPFDAFADAIFAEVAVDLIAPDPNIDRSWALEHASAVIAGLVDRDEGRSLPLVLAAGASWLERGQVATARTVLEPLRDHRMVASASLSNRTAFHGVLGFAQLNQGDWIAARRSMAAAVDGLDSDSDLGAAERLSIGVEAWLRGELDEGWNHARRALEELVDVTRFASTTLCSASHLALWVGKLDEAADALTRARAVVTEHGSPAAVAEAHRRSAVVESLCGRHDTAWRWARRATSLDAGSVGRQAQSEAVMALVAWNSGDVDEAEVWARRFGASSRGAFDAAAIMLGVPPAAASAAHRGRREAAATMLGWLDSFLESQNFGHHPGAHGPLDDAQRILGAVDTQSLRRWRARGASLTPLQLGSLMAGDEPAAMM